MSTALQSTPPTTPAMPRGGYPLDRDRGTWGMLLIIASEATLFVCLFGSYFFLENNKNRWAINKPPKLHDAFIELAILLVSGLVLCWGERQLRGGQFARARIAIAVTTVLGLAFLTVQGFEYSDHLKTLTPFTNSYGSIFYAITTVDAAHVILGILILFYVLFLPRYGVTTMSPYRPYRIAALYWYFVDVVWLVIVGLLYVMPNIRVYGF